MATHTVHTDPFRCLRPIPEVDPQTTTTGTATFQPLAYDVFRDGSELVLAFDVPGIDPAEIEVAVEDRYVVVSVRREPAPRSGVDLIERGRPHGRFSQRLLLGSSWDLEHLQASTQYGVLQLRAPHLAERVRRTVRVDHVNGHHEGALGEGGRRVEAPTPSVPDRTAFLDEDRSVHSAA